MALISDPDGLSQGGVTSCPSTTFTGASSNTITINSTSVPAVTAGDYIEVRDASTAANNGLYVVDSTVASTSITATKVSLSGAVTAPANDGSQTIRILGTDANEKNIHFDTDNLLITFLPGFGSTTALDEEGVSLQALYSFCKEEWKSDNDLIKFAFPMTAVTPEQFEFNSWKPVDESESSGISTTPAANTRQLFRTGGWSEIDSNGLIEQLYFCWLTLGNIDSSSKTVGDKPYYFFSSQSAATEATFAGPANEGIEAVSRVDLSGAGTIGFPTSSTFTRTTGSFVSDGFLVGDYLFIQGATETANNGSFQITNVAATTLTVAGTPFTTDAADTPVVAIDRRQTAFTTRIRVFGKTYGQSTTNDIGVTALTNQVYRFPLSEATDNVIVDLANSETAGNLTTLFTNISTTPVAPYEDMGIGYFGTSFTRTGFNGGSGDFGVLIEADFDGGGDSPSSEQIYAFVQATLLETGNINDPDGRIAGEDTGTSIVGLLAEPLVSLSSTGNTITTLAQTSNPASGGTGVAIDNFNSNDTNRTNLTDDLGAVRSFPFVSAGTINFNANLSTDTDAIYKMFFTNDDGGSNTGRDFGTIDAIVVNDNGGSPISGSVPQNAGGSSVAFDYDYDGNVQRGNGSPVDAPITIVAIGLSTGQYVVASGTITRATGLSFSLVSTFERNFSGA